MGPAHVAVPPEVFWKTALERLKEVVLLAEVQDLSSEVKAFSVHEHTEAAVGHEQEEQALAVESGHASPPQLLPSS